MDAGGSLQGIDNLSVVLSTIADELEETRKGRTHFFHERSVASATVHQIRWHLPPKLEARFHNQPRKPRNAVDRRAFGRQISHRCDVACGDSTHDVQEIVTSDRLHCDDLLQVRLTVTEIIVDEIKELLRGTSDGMKILDVLRAEHALRRASAGLRSKYSAGMDLAEFLDPIGVVHKNLWLLRMPRENQSALICRMALLLERVVAHSHLFVPQWTAGTHRMVYSARRLALPPSMPPYAANELWAVQTWWAK